MSLETLIIVPCHGTYVGTEPVHIRQGIHWRGQHPEDCKYYSDQIEHALLLAGRKDAVLMFAGGRTLEDAPLSEAQGYWNACQQRQWLGVDVMVLKEEQSRDSFENLQNSLNLYASAVGPLRSEQRAVNPRSIIIVGWKFQEATYRFHAKTLYVGSIVLYQGQNDPPGNICVPASPRGIAYGAERNKLIMFQYDSRGESGVLLQKKKSRTF